MKLRRVLAALAASAVAVSAMAVASFAEGPYTATLGFADGTWGAQDWATTTTIDGDGTYSITGNCLYTYADEDTGEDVTEAAAGTGIMVFVVDIAQLGADLGLNEAPEDASDDDDSWKYATGDVKVTDVKVTSGDTEFEIAQDNVKVGDIESKGNLRIEIYNAYGPTVDAPALDPATFAFAAEDQFTVTFTITGLSADEGDTGAGDVDADTDADSKGESPDTGIEDVAVVAGLAIVAGGAIAISRKRK